MNSEAKLPTRFQGAVERLDGNTGLLREMAAITSEDLPEICSKTADQIEQGNCQEAARSLHKLKGMLSTFESDGVTLQLQEMIHAARKDDAVELKQLYDANRADIDDLVHQIAELAATFRR